MTPNHRIATRADLEQIVAIYNATIPSREVTADIEPVSVHSRLPWFEAHVPGFRPLWVIERQGRIAAWLSFSTFYDRPAYNRTAEISVYVDDAFRRQGIGNYLLGQAIAHAPEIRVDRLIGFIFRHNTASLNLFRKADFSVWGELPGVTELDGVGRDVIIVGRAV
jgi:phosphinothricin acetyltransferase